MSTQSGAITQQERNESAVRLTLPARYGRFGAFEADFQKEELYQNGQRVKVQSKLFQALLLLLSRASEVVTRDEVRRHLWPHASLTNLDANVNTTMNKLRQVLGDSPESAAYIETIPRRGYSFIAGVAFSDTQGQPTESANSELSATSAATGSERLWSDKRLQTFARMVTLLMAGMIVGALLAFAWTSSQRNSQHGTNDKKASASLVRLPFFS